MVKVLGFSAEYVESLSPAERKLYWMYYERDEAEKAKMQEEVPMGPNIGSPIDPLASE